MLATELDADQRREIVNTQQRFDALREPIKRARDAAQARVVGALVAAHMPHLTFERTELRMLPAPVFDAAASLFVAG